MTSQTTTDKFSTEIRARAMRMVLPAGLGQPAVKGSRSQQALGVDFTYVSTWGGMVYVAFVIDTCARRIVRWRGRPMRPSSSTRLSRRCRPRRP